MTLEITSTNKQIFIVTKLKEGHHNCWRVTRENPARMFENQQPRGKEHVNGRHFACLGLCDAVVADQRYPGVRFSLEFGRLVETHKTNTHISTRVRLIRAVSGDRVCITCVASLFLYIG